MQLLSTTKPNYAFWGGRGSGWCIIENMSGKFTCNPISYNIYWKKEKDRLKKYEI